MGKKIILSFLLFSFSLIGFSQSGDIPSDENACNCPGGKKKKGVFYLGWGYNRDWFSKSDLHFQNSGSDNYNFTLYDVKAKDRPGFNEIMSTAIHGNITIPQYVYRIGYYFNNKREIGVELNFDHAKYIMVQDQSVHIKGQIHDIKLDKDTVLKSSFLEFEHSDGANFYLGNFIKRKSFFHSENSKHWLSMVIKPGLGVVIPKTRVNLFGTLLDNKFHIAGWMAGIETGIRYDGFKHFFTELTCKGVFANYSNVLTIGTGRANHNFGCFEVILCAGYQFGW